MDKHGFIGDKGNKVKNCLAIRQNKGEGQGVARKRYIVGTKHVVHGYIRLKEKK